MTAFGLLGAIVLVVGAVREWRRLSDQARRKQQAWWESMRSPRRVSDD